MTTLSAFTVTIITKTDSPDNVLPNAPLEIRNRLANGTSGTLASIFSDAAGAFPITQTGATTDSLGQFTFYASPAPYNAVFDNNGTPVISAIDVGLTTVSFASAIDRLNPATVAIMIDDIALDIGDIATTQGYLASGDGGDNKYEIVASGTGAADGGRFINLTTHQAKGLFPTGIKNNKQFGTAADGVAVDDTELLAFDAAGGGDIIGGIIRVQSNISLVSDYNFPPSGDGVIAPDSSFTITWSGSITAGDYKIFDGNFKVSKVNNLPEVKVVWFGAKSSDLLTDMTNQALADANAKAIRQAASMVAIGVPLGIYVTPILKLINGLCVVDDDNNSGVILDVDSYMTVLGYGDASVLRPMDGAKAFDVISMTVDGANSMLLDKFQIYGEASAQTLCLPPVLDIIKP